MSTIAMPTPTYVLMADLSSLVILPPYIRSRLTLWNQRLASSVKTEQLRILPCRYPCGLDGAPGFAASPGLGDAPRPAGGKLRTGKRRVLTGHAQAIGLMTSLAVG